MSRLVLLTDRSPERVLPGALALGLDLKVEPLSPDALARLPDLEPEAVLVDGVSDPAKAFGLLEILAGADPGVPLVAVVETGDLERYPWEEVADEFLYPGAPSPEVSMRLFMLRRRLGPPPEGAIRLGRLALSTDTYQVTVGNRPLDLTFKEFELLRFLASRPGRVFTRAALLREVWGYDFYGGTRTVDVHIRRLRAKLGPENEHLIETVRGVGYRAADVGPEA
jgi:DNA-binding response OmpR family regulator